MTLDYHSPDYGLSPAFLALVDMLTPAPYWQRRKALRGQSTRARFIYKYFDFDSRDSLSIKKVRDVLVESRLYLATPAEFNDPNEFRAILTFTEDAVARRKWAMKVSKKHLQHNPNALPHIRGTRRKLEELVSQTMSKSISDPQSLEKNFINQRNKNGVFCFSENARSLLMWSHYARGHKGICVQFEAAKCLGVIACALPVEYRKTVPKIIWPDEQRRIWEPVIGKSSEWEYERERRYVSTRVFASSLPFDGSAVTAIILGSRFNSSGDDGAKLTAIIEDRRRKSLPPLKIYAAAPGIEDYNLKIMQQA